MKKYLGRKIHDDTMKWNDHKRQRQIKFGIQLEMIYQKILAKKGILGKYWVKVKECKQNRDFQMKKMKFLLVTEYKKKNQQNANKCEKKQG